MGKHEHATEAAMSRFWSKVDKAGECWNWTAATGAGGYGVFKLAPRMTVTAHRLSLAVATQADPSGMEVRHACDNVLCVNPDHMCWGTRAENEADKGYPPFGKSSFPPLSPSRSAGAL